MSTTLKITHIKNTLKQRIQSVPQVGSVHIGLAANTIPADAAWPVVVLRTQADRVLENKRARIKRQADIAVEMYVRGTGNTETQQDALMAAIAAALFDDEQQPLNGQALSLNEITGQRDESPPGSDISTHVSLLRLEYVQ